LTLTTLSAHRKSELGHSANTNREHDDRAGERGGQQRHRHGNATVRREKLQSHVSRVLSNEHDESNAKKNGNGDGRPRRRRSRVAKVFTFFHTVSTVILRGLFCRRWIARDAGRLVRIVEITHVARVETCEW
jgi:hypothetical protein